MRQATSTITLSSCGRGLYEFTDRLHAWTLESGIRTGLLTVFVRHTSASLIVQENADPEVQRDLERFLSRLVPDGDRLFRHTLEGPDDMPAHVRAALTQTSLSIPVANGTLALGTWQGVYLYEHRTSAHRRELVLHLSGE
jgi:secondary thiamine-phosphate synthase enzyme